MHKNKHLAFSILVSAIVLMVSCSGGKPNYKASLKTDTDSASYFIGYNFGVSIAGADMEDFNINAMARGIQEALKKGKDIDELKMQELQMFLNNYFMNLQARTNEKSIKEGQDWLDGNKKKQGVVTLPSGLQYKIIREGSGIKPTFDDLVEVIYHGSLIDGTVFDSTKERGDTATFPVGGVVQGFGEALTLMNEGSIWEVYIPGDLGYGPNPPPYSPIKPNSVLIFEIEMVKVIKE